jgi:hypothetical protein
MKRKAGSGANGAESSGAGAESGSGEARGAAEPSLLRLSEVVLTLCRPS